jgi:hypothetical protein
MAKEQQQASEENERLKHDLKDAEKKVSDLEQKAVDRDKRVERMNLAQKEELRMAEEKWGREMLDAMAKVSSVEAMASLHRLNGCVLEMLSRDLTNKDYHQTPTNKTKTEMLSRDLTGEAAFCGGAGSGAEGQNCAEGHGSRS